MSRVLGKRFFNRPPTKVSRALLGKFLIKKCKTGAKAYMITEVEAYGGTGDLASHARFGQTKRNTPMFGPAGVWYVYFTYGIHWMLNVVTLSHGKPSAVLIRGVEGISGPARLTKALKIDGKLNGKPADRISGLWIEDRGLKIPAGRIRKSPRIGVDYAGPVWSKKHWRFYIG